MTPVDEPEFVMVPRELTDAMSEAYTAAADASDGPAAMYIQSRAYRAMLAAAPAIPAKGEDVVEGIPTREIIEWAEKEYDKHEQELVERVARAICQEQCAGFGEPACWKVGGQWPNPNCESCHAMAKVAIAAMAKTLPC